MHRHPFFSGFSDPRGGHWHGHHHGADFSRRGGPFGGFGGRGGRGGPGWFGFAPGGPPGFDFRAGRKISSADLQLLLLALLGEQGRHGYDLIKAIEERSRGFYVPSPGVIYPALTYLEEAGDAVAEAKGARKLYELTDQGRARLTERRADADALLAQLDELGRRMGRLRDAIADGQEGEDGDPLEGMSERDMWRDIKGIFMELKKLHHHNRHPSRAQHAKIASVLRRAATEIRQIIEAGDE